ncbi:hypothetical protein [Gorillibacterium sp. CAU 1737]|uniref:hypothetical protein n=1 Tax=Gorillibacterium sp. CAU 1737 TaxID=3140362 RepID=UPI003261583D
MAQLKPISTRGSRKQIVFAGGINNEAPEISIDDAQSVDEQGWDTDSYPSLHSRKGRTPYGATGGANTNFLTNYAQTHLVRSVGTKLQYDNAGTWTDISGTWTDTDWDATNFNSKLILTNGTDVVQSWNGSALTALTDAPKGKYISNNSIRVFIAQNDTIKFSKYLDETNWTDTSSAGMFEFYTDDGGPVTGLKPYGDSIIAFKANAIAEIVGTGQTAQKHRLVNISNSIGCVSAKTIQEVSAPGGNFLFFLGQNDVYMFSGGRPQSIGNNIRKFINAINPAYTSRCFGATDGTRYFLGLVTGANTQPDTLCMFDPRFGIWRVNKTSDNLRYSAFFRNNWYAGDATGQTFKMLQGQSDNGSPVTWMYTTKDFDEGIREAEKEYYALHLQYTAAPGASLTIQVSIDQGQSYITIGDPITATGYAQNVNEIIPLDTVPISNWLRFRFSGSGEMTLHEAQRMFLIHPVQI